MMTWFSDFVWPDIGELDISGLKVKGYNYSGKLTNCQTKHCNDLQIPRYQLGMKYGYMLFYFYESKIS